MALHVAGHLRTFIGAHFDNTGYFHDRDAEFSRRNVQRPEIISQLDKAIQAAQDGLAKGGDQDLDALYKPELLGTVTVRDFLIHPAVRLGYHLGRADYHRRIMTGGSETVDNIATGELASARVST